MKSTFIFLISFINAVSVTKANPSSNPEITSVTVVSNTRLSAGANNSSVVLKWSAKNETSGSYYEIERSFYSNNFNTIATLQIPFVSSSNIQNYSINDNSSEFINRKIVYYRVKQINGNGQIIYSNITVVNLADIKEKTTESLVNSSCKTIPLRFSSEQNGNAVIRIAGHTGETAAIIKVIASKGANTINLNNLADLPKGIYVTEISVNGVTVDNQKIIVE